ncbi:hypothetical protein NYP07_23260 [Pelomonas aquatica]|nr:hypothetical protein [Pelomonas aquatica]
MVLEAFGCRSRLFYQRRILLRASIKLANASIDLRDTGVISDFVPSLRLMRKIVVESMT